MWLKPIIFREIISLLEYIPKESKLFIQPHEKEKSKNIKFDIIDEQSWVVKNFTQDLTGNRLISKQFAKFCCSAVSVINPQ